MTAPVPRFSERLLRPWLHSGAPAAKEAGRQMPVLVPSRPLGLPSSIAEFLLVFRLRANRRSALSADALSADVLERALGIVQVTCQHWFGRGTAPRRSADHRHD